MIWHWLESKERDVAALDIKRKPSIVIIAEKWLLVGSHVGQRVFTSLIIHMALFISPGYSWLVLLYIDHCWVVYNSWLDIFRIDKNNFWYPDFSLFFYIKKISVCPVFQVDIFHINIKPEGMLGEERKAVFIITNSSSGQLDSEMLFCQGVAGGAA